MHEDVYFKKTIDFRHEGHILQFRVSQDLFSSHQVDVGTARLLRSLPSEFMATTSKILDLGCGYGPIGLTLKKLSPETTVHLVDRDALALAYTKQNASLNHLAGGLAIYGSLGYEQVQETDFDLIISNIPGKAGDDVIRDWLLRASRYVRLQGMVAIVVVAPLAELVAETLAAPGIDILYQESRSGHAIFHYRFTTQFDDALVPEARGDDLYLRAQLDFFVGDAVLPLQTAKGLPEFDTLSYQSRLLLKALEKHSPASIRRAVLFNPGQGHVSLVVWKLLSPECITLVDRDLLSLTYTRRNLLLNTCSSEAVSVSHQVGLRVPDLEPSDLVMGVLREDEGTLAIAETVHQAGEQLTPDGLLMVAGGSTAISRLEKSLYEEKTLRVYKRTRNKGKSLLVLGKVR